jgi:hypothetical protein
VVTRKTELLMRRGVGVGTGDRIAGAAVESLI